MCMVVAAIGRFDIDIVIDAAKEVIQQESEREFEGWGLAYSYGNRLESARGGRDASGQLSFDGLEDVKTDMAVMCLNEGGERVAGFGPEQPFVRREQGQVWAFCHAGSIKHPEKLVFGDRVPGGPSTSHRYFLHLIAAFDPDNPLVSVARAQSALAGEPELGFILMNSDVLVVGCCPGRDDQRPALWFGGGKLLRMVAPTQVRLVPDLKWEPITDPIAVSRFRRSIG